MKFAFIHYNIGTRDGVNTVIFNNAIALKKHNPKIKISFVGSIKDKFTGLKRGAKYIDIPELDITKKLQDSYAKNDVFEYLRNGERIYEKLKKLLGDYNVVICENPNIGVHPAATYGFYRYVKKNDQQRRKTKIFYRLHDFPMDRHGNFQNILKFKGREASPYWHKVIFPTRKHFGYIVINSSDIKLLRTHGIIWDNKINYIPNPINEDISYDDENHQKLREKLEKKFKIDPEAKIIYYPVRIVPRKNVLEAIFITVLLNLKLQEKFHLVISLKPSFDTNKRYHNRIQKFVEKYNLPVTLGIDNFVSYKRIKKNGRIFKYSVGDMYKVCDIVITTSILEGFGMFFIESWYFGKPIIGRDLPLITPDFKRHGVNLEHLYGTLFIGDKDFKDLTISEKMKYIKKLSDPKFIEDFIQKNKLKLMGLFRMFNKEIEKDITKNNQKIVKTEYSSEVSAKKILQAIRDAD